MMPPASPVRWSSSMKPTAWLLWTPRPQGPDLIPITPKTGSLFQPNRAHYTWTRFLGMREPVDPGIFVHGAGTKDIGRKRWRPEIHRIDRQRLGLGGLGRGPNERFIVGAEMEPGRYRIYSAG